MRSDRVSVKQLVFKLDLDHPQLQASLKRQGQTFPLRVKTIENGYGAPRYLVIDGNKRASILAKMDPDHMVDIDIIDDFTTAGSNYWGNRNHH